MPKDKNGQEMPKVVGVGCSIQVEDRLLLRKMLLDHNISLQSFLDMCIQAFIRQDRRLRGILEDWKEAKAPPVRIRAEKEFTITERERLLKELEENSPIEEGEEP